jgi:hypothetical protein
MPLYGNLTTAELKSLFAEEVAAAGGEVSDAFDDGSRLFARSVLPRTREVRKADKVQAGVALRAVEEGVSVHPYVFRLVCSNGAIIAHAAQTRHVRCEEFTPADEAADAVREAVRACCDEDAFAAAAREMQAGVQTPADVALHLMHFFTRLPEGVRQQLIDAVVERFSRDGDASRFGLMNAVTSLARDTHDPELRWRLEELGGGVPVGPVAPRPRSSAAARVLVG